MNWVQHEYDETLAPAPGDQVQALKKTLYVDMIMFVLDFRAFNKEFSCNAILKDDSKYTEEVFKYTERTKVWTVRQIKKLKLEKLNTLSIVFKAENRVDLINIDYICVLCLSYHPLE